jgi:Reverse transcriptase (RNA-dependent DNA polymerase)
MWLKDAEIRRAPCPFYVIPKLHKAKLSSRPITAQHSYVLAPMSCALAKILQMEVDQISEIAKDSKTVMQQLENFKCSKNFVFMTYDVEQLYPSIDLHDAIKTLHKSVPIMREDRNFWTKVLQLIMFNNYVSAENKIYRQMKGTATGTQVAPPFANLYLYHKLKEILRHPKIQYRSRFIDDGIILIDDEETALEIAKQLNDACGLKFTFAVNRTQATYLDITVYKGPKYELHRKLDTKVFFKATNKLLYLPAISHHPGIHKTGVIKGEAIRCLRNTSDKAKWLNAMNWIFKGLRQRGYSGRIIQQKFRHIRFEDRMKYITNERTDSKPKQITIMTQFNKETRHHWRKLLNKYPLEAILRPKRLGILNKKQISLISDWPPQIIFKDFAKISKALISAKQAFVRPSTTQP